ncbi:MAG: hypothetical protein HY424_00395 [Candidatus Levybacteria bacterium]|nr:hypothetical protein [Candidatus Levybacteria bacterium]
MNRSRLTRKFEQRTKKNLFFSLLGIVVVIFLVFKFGIPLLVNFSLFLTNFKGNQAESQNNKPLFIAPPILDSFPQATSSADIVISGIASKNQIINLYINGDMVNTTKTKDDGTFSFKETIPTGENTIKAKAVVQDKESDFSNSIVTAFKTAPPSLNITSPVNDTTYGKDQNFADIKGATDADVKVTVNGFWAITDSNGNFSYRLPLQNGENKIRITATDTAGNKTEKEIKLNYSQ